MDPTIGREPAKHRPWLVLSEPPLHRARGPVIAVPRTHSMASSAPLTGGVGSTDLTTWLLEAPPDFAGGAVGARGAWWTTPAAGR